MTFKDRFLKNNILMFLGAGVGNVANLLCQILVVKKLDCPSYGAFNSLLSTFMIISLPANAINTMVVKFTASYSGLGQKKEANIFLFAIMRHMLFVGIAFLLLYFICGLNLKGYLKLDSVVPVYLTGAMLFCTVLSIVPQGGLQGFEDFTWFSAILGFGGLLKALFVFIFLVLGWGLMGVLGGYLAAQTAVLLLNLILLKEVFVEGGAPPAEGLREKYRFVMPSLIALGCVAVLTNADVILIKHFFSADAAGCYSVAQLIGKIVLFVPGAISLVMFPNVSGLHAQKKDARHLLRQSLKYGAVLCLGVAAAYNLFPEAILEMLTGKSNSEMIFCGRLFSIAMTFFALTNTLILYQLSISSFRFLKSLVLLSLLQAFFISAFHRSLAQVLYILLANSAVLFVLNLHSALATGKNA